MKFLLVLVVNLLIVVVGGLLAWTVPGESIRSKESPIPWGWTIRDIVLVAVLAAIVGVIQTGESYIFQTSLALGGAIGSAIFQGAFGWGYVIAFMLIRKPGSMLAFAVLETSVEALTGNPAGIYTVGWGLTQGLSAEAVMAFIRWAKISPWVFFISSAVNAQFGTVWSWYLYGWEDTMLAYWISIPLTLLAGGSISGLIGYYIGLALSKTGLVRAATRDSIQVSKV
jgi:energy-coupling factor transport system substrate-specific component